MEDVKVYMVVNLDIEDKDTYLKYEKGFFPILKKYGGEFITGITILNIKSCLNSEEKELHYGRLVL